MTPEEIRAWLQGVLDAKTASGEPMTVDDLKWIRKALDASILRYQYDDTLPVLKHTRTCMSC